MANLTSYNQKLKQRLEGDVTTEDMVAIHELTYTLENALETIASEVKHISALLEEVHMAAEALDAQAIKKGGEQYLQESHSLAKP